MNVEMYQVDAFTDKVFSGNPAAVCLLEGPGEKNWMQNVASEMNLSETAFVHRQDKGFELRWFTPAVEVDLCGHATLASAHVLWETKVLSDNEKAIFFTKSGVLTAELRGNWIALDFPAEREKSAEVPSGLLSSLGVDPKYVGKNRFDYLVEVDSEAILRNMAPDFPSLRKIATRGVIVTCRSDSEDFDFVSRFFAPQVGVNEDPVTGSAYCCLGPYWGSRLAMNTVVGYQASARGGIVRVTMKEDRVGIEGQAVTVLRAKLVNV